MAYRSTTTLRCLLPGAIAIAVAAAPWPTIAQGAKPAQSDKAAPKGSIEGLPLYSSDGKVVGKVIAMGLDEDNQPVLVAEVERQLGIGPMAIAVPTDMFVRKGARIELTITEAEVATRLKQ
jgi:hypothetical protein